MSAREMALNSHKRFKPAVVGMATLISLMGRTGSYIVQLKPRTSLKNSGHPLKEQWVVQNPSLSGCPF
jgi:hypothetical protein